MKRFSMLPSSLTISISSLGIVKPASCIGT
jgi:hypothetical protein